MPGSGPPLALWLLSQHPPQRGFPCPLRTIHTSTDHEPFEIRTDDRVYTATDGKDVTLFVEQEALASFTTQIRRAELAKERSAARE